jgi:hypothetical protein
VYHGTVFNASVHGSQLAWQNQTATQNQSNQQLAPEFQVLAQAAATILNQLPAYGLEPQEQQEVEAAANEVLAEVQQPNPERRRVPRALAGLKGFLMPIAIEAAREEVRELAQQSLDQINLPL